MNVYIADGPAEGRRFRYPTPLPDILVIAEPWGRSPRHAQVPRIPPRPRRWGVPAQTRMLLWWPARNSHSA